MGADVAALLVALVVAAAMGLAIAWTLLSIRRERRLGLDARIDVRTDAADRAAFRRVIADARPLALSALDTSELDR